MTGRLHATVRVTARVAGRIAADLRAHGRGGCVRRETERVTGGRSRYDWCSVAASVHAGHHEREMIAFVKRDASTSTGYRGVYLVTLSEAGAEDLVRRRSAVRRSRVQQMIDVFVRETGWRPERAQWPGRSLPVTTHPVPHETDRA
jgi:menaquinone-dependent protoporphyrinogen IX oxidase